MTRQATDNLYIELDYFTPEDYYIYEANAEADIASAFGFNCVTTAGATKEASANLSVSVSQSTQETRVRTFLAPMGTLFDITMTVDALRITEVTLIVNTSITATGDVNRSAAITLSNIVTLNAQAIKLVETSSQFTSTFTQASTGNKVNRVVGDATIYVGGLYGTLEFDSSVKKFGSHSLKFLANNSNQSGISTNIAYTGSKLFALRLTDTTYYNYGYCETTDGNTWTSGTTDIVEQPIGQDPERVEYLNNRLVAWVPTQAEYFHSSTNGGTSWTRHTTSGNINDTAINDVVYSGTHYIRVGANSNNRGSILRSTNLVTWSSGATTNIGGSGTSSDIGGTLRTVNFRDAIVAGSTIAAVATVNRSDNGLADANYLLFSTDHGANWTGVTNISNLGFMGIGYNGSNLWVVVGRSGDIFTSATINGTYTKRTSGVTTTLNKVSYTNGLWIAVGDSNVLLTSTNGTTWTQRTVSFSGTTTPFYANSRWWVSDLSNNLYSSTDGTTWISNSTAITASLPKSAEIAFADNPDWSSWKTIDFWAYVPSRIVSDYGFIALYIEQDSDVYNYSWQVRLQTTPSTIQPILLYIDVNGNSAGDTVPIASGSAYNTWNHYRIVNDGGRLSFYINGTRVDTATGFTNQYFDGTNLRIYTEGPGSDVRIDELLITDAVLTDPTLTSYTVPTTEYTNNDSTDLLLHFNNSFADDNIAPPKVVSAVVALNTAVTQTVSANKTAEGVGAFSTQTTLNAVVEKAIVAQAQLNSAVSQIVDATRIFDLTAQFDAIAIQLTAIGLIGDFFVNCDNTASLSADVNVIAQGEIDLTATTTLDASAERIRDSEIDLSLTATQTVAGNVTTQGEIDLESTVTQTTQGQRVRYADTAIVTLVTVTADAQAILEGEVDLTATTTLALTVSKIINAVITTEAIATQLTATAKTGQGLIACDLTATLTALGEVTSGSVVNLQSTAALTATVGKLLSANSVLTSNSTLTAQGSVVNVVDADLNSTAELSAQALVTRGLSSALTAHATLTAQTEKVIKAQAQLSTVAQATATLKVTKNFVAVLPVIASQLTAVVETSRGVAALSARFTVVCNTSVIYIDPALTYQIPKELRTYQVPDVTPKVTDIEITYVVPREDRTYNIVYDLRDDIVIPEIREYII